MLDCHHNRERISMNEAKKKGFKGKRFTNIMNHMEINSINVNI